MGENKVLARKQSRGGLTSPRRCDAVSELDCANLQLNSFPDSDHLAIRTSRGKGVTEDLGKAAELYQKAADQGIKVPEAT